MKEEHEDVGPNSWFFRIAIKSACLEPVTYAVAMNHNDWTINMVHAFSDMQLEGCHVATKDKDVTECLITLDKDHPVTGW